MKNFHFSRGLKKAKKPPAISKIILRLEVLAQEVLRNEAGAELVVQDRFQARGHGIGELDDVLCQNHG